MTNDTDPVEPICQCDGVDVWCAHDELATIKKLKPHPRNPNKHPASQVKLLAKIIGSAGWRTPITVSKRSGYIIRGHGRLMAAKKLKKKAVPVDYQEYKSEEAEIADLIADNRIAELADLDLPEVADLIREINIEDFDLDMTGYTEESLEELLGLDPPPGLGGDEDPVPEVPKDPVTKLGDLWTLGRHRLLCGDATSKDDICRLLADTKPDMIHTDPPYGISAVSTTTSKIGGAAATKFGKIEGENWVEASTYAEIAGDNDTGTAKAMFDLVKEMGIETVIIWGGNYFTHFLPPSPCWIIWDKENTGNFADVEIAWCSQNKGAKLYRWLWNGLSRKGGRDLELLSRVHPTQKPVGLFVEIFKDFPGQVVADFFGGSGSILMACHVSDRTCLAMELSEQYCDVICQRYLNLTSESPVREGDGALFNELKGDEE